MEEREWERVGERGYKINQIMQISAELQLHVGGLK